MEDKFRSEYDLKSLKIRKMGAKRKSFGETIIKLYHVRLNSYN